MTDLKNLLGVGDGKRRGMGGPVGNQGRKGRGMEESGSESRQLATEKADEQGTR
jgi:hypothetical protein